MDLPILDISYKWNHITHDLCRRGGVWLLFTYVFEVHPCCRMHEYFLLLTNNILLHGYTTFSLTISQLIDIWVVSTFRLLWIKLLWTFVYKFLCGHMLSFHLGMYLWVVLLDHMVTFYIFNFLRNCQTVFQNGCTIFYSHQSYGRVTVTPHPHKACTIFFIIISIQGSVKQHLILVLIWL